MDKEKFLKLYNNIFPLGVLNDLSFEDFFNKLKAFGDEFYPNDDSFRSGDPELSWWIILHDCFDNNEEEAGANLNTSFAMDDKWAAEDFLWNVNRVLGGAHKYSILYEEEDPVNGTISFEYEWDGTKSSVKMENYFDTSVTRSINKILDEQDDVFYILQYELIEGEEVYYFRISNDRILKFRKLWENPFIELNDPIDLSSKVKADVDYLDGVQSPSKEKCFINLQVFSEDENAKRHDLYFQWEKADASLEVFNDKVEKGQTLEQGVRVCLKRDLGIENVVRISSPERQDYTVNDKAGTPRQMYQVTVQVKYEPVKALQSGLNIGWDGVTETRLPVNDLQSGLKEGILNTKINSDNYFQNNVVSDYVKEMHLKEQELTKKFEFINTEARNPYKIKFFIWNRNNKYLNFKQAEVGSESPTLSLTVQKGEKMRDVLWTFFRENCYFSEYWWELSDLELEETTNEGNSSIMTYVLGICGDFDFKGGEPLGVWKDIPFELKLFYDNGLRFKISEDNTVLKLFEFLGYEANFIVYRSRVGNTEIEPEEAVSFFERGGSIQGNKFGTKEEGLAFVNKLYELGAMKVTADKISGSGFHAMFLKVHLPDNSEERKKLFEFINDDEITKADYGLEGMTEDKWQKEIDLSWD